MHTILFTVWDSDRVVNQDLEFDADIIKAVKKALRTTGQSKVIAFNKTSGYSCGSKITQSDVGAIRVTLDNIRFNMATNAR